MVNLKNKKEWKKSVKIHLRSKHVCVLVTCDLRYFSYILFVSSCFCVSLLVCWMGVQPLCFNSIIRCRSAAHTHDTPTEIKAKRKIIHKEWEERKKINKWNSSCCHVLHSNEDKFFHICTHSRQVLKKNWARKKMNPYRKRKPGTLPYRMARLLLKLHL